MYVIMTSIVLSSPATVLKAKQVHNKTDAAHHCGSEEAMLGSTGAATADCRCSHCQRHRLQFCLSKTPPSMSYTDAFPSNTPPSVLHADASTAKALVFNAVYRCLHRQRHRLQCYTQTLSMTNTPPSLLYSRVCEA